MPVSTTYHGSMAPPRAPAGSTSPARPSDLRRAQILAAAAQLFASHGFHGSSIDDLGAAIGMTGPAVYRYFRSKEAILSALLVDVSRSLLAGGRARLVDATGWDAVHALVDWHVTFALDNPTLIVLQSRDLGALAPTEQRRVRRLQRAYVQIWVDAIVAAGGGTDGATALAAAHAVFGLINSTPHSARLERPAMAGLLLRMAMSAIAGATGREPAG